MITTQDQEDLLRLVSQYLKRDIACVAIGGTAMMFYGYKNATKDIDLVFDSIEDRSVFIDAIRELGYREMSLKGVYDERRRANPDAPLMFSRGDERFDLFVASVFGFSITSDASFTQRHDFPERLTVKVLPKEQVMVLKAVTNREKDYEDIATIVKTEKGIDWSAIIAIVKEHISENEWLLLDLEETLQKLKSVTFIPEERFKELYEAQESVLKRREGPSPRPIGKR